MSPRKEKIDSCIGDIEKYMPLQPYTKCYQQKIFQITF